MSLFLIGLVMLFLGYVTYGKIVEQILGPDDRKTPALTHSDGLDYVPMPTWKNMLIHLLNIAGVGPVIGVIGGIKFGVICFIIIPVGNIIGGATYDMISGFISLRKQGINLPEMIRQTSGSLFYKVFLFFVSLTLLLIVAVFINIPANLVNVPIPSHNVLLPAILVIFLYYVVATIMPIDKIIGRFYPIFGALLLLASLALFISLIIHGIKEPSIFMESAEFQAAKFSFANGKPILPMLFVTIACGIISGFHATQSPMVARTLRTEHDARKTFYGMMVLEGVIAMLWAAGALVIYNKFPEMLSENSTVVLSKIADYLLMPGVSQLTIISVIILSITSGDTALRSLRLSIAEGLKMNQKPIAKRMAIVIPLIVVITGLLIWSNKDSQSFGFLWNYFAWANQVIAACALTCTTIWLVAKRKLAFISIIPQFFIIFIVVTFFMWTSIAHGGPVGFGLELFQAYLIGIFMAIISCGYSVYTGFTKRGDFDYEDIDSSSK